MYKIALIHGMFFSPSSMVLVEQYLKKHGYVTKRFGYNTYNVDESKLFEQLSDFFADASESAIVGWSLGGILARIFVENNPQLNIGKIITLGTPHSGSEMVRNTYNGVNKITEPDAVKYLKHTELPWESPTEIHSIAGGFDGDVTGLLGRKGDGVLKVEETHADYIASHHVVSEHHFSLVASKQVFDIILKILSNTNVSQSA